MLLTGGTIGMLENTSGLINPSSDDPLEVEFFELGNRFDLDGPPISLYRLDSADVGPRQWSQLSRRIATHLRQGCHGVVVAGGTDTLAFTASAVSYALGPRLSNPVVFTGSQTTADIAWGDARSNLLRACLVATDDNLGEVVVSFGDRIIRSVRAVKRDDRHFEGFESLGYPDLGSISERVNIHDELIRVPQPGLMPNERTMPADFSDGVLVIPQSPGLYPAVYTQAIEHDLAQAKETDERRIRGIIIQSLGAGNLPTKGDYAFAPLIELATHHEIPVILANQYPADSANFGRYNPPAIALRAGAIPVANMTSAALVAKFSWLLAQAAELSRDELVNFMWDDYVGEVDPVDSRALREIYYHITG